MLIKTIKPDKMIVFPQANNIYKILKYVDKKTYNYHNGYFDKIESVFGVRQLSYYKNAAVYLGLLKSEIPTELSMHIFALDKDLLFINVVLLILKNEVFLSYYLYRSIDDVVHYLMLEYEMNYSTAVRRASTVKNWINWCDAIIKENEITIEGELN